MARIHASPVVVIALAAAVLLTAGGLLRTGPPTTVFRAARVYPSPGEMPIDDAVVVVRSGRILDVGTGEAYHPSRGATVVDCTGLFLIAGFWNSHVHFTDPKWQQAASAPADRLTGELEQMLVRHGFTTVLDAGSDWSITSALRRRIEDGEISGPRLLTTGGIVFPKGGAPGAAPVRTPGTISGGMAEAADPAGGAAIARAKLDDGVDALKAYAATWWNDPPVRMSAATLRAIGDEAAQRRKPLLAHPSDLTGLETALEGGVDILAHTTAAAGPWPPSLVARMRRHGMALIPTLKLWRAQFTREGVPDADARAIQQAAVGQLRAYAEAGGEILFGTDVGYMEDDDPTEEYELMASAGMDFRQILASLTTAPAARFGNERAGRIAPGHDADLVFLRADPAQDVRAFADVALVVRAGRIVYDRVAP